MLDLARLRVLRELKLRGTVGAVAEALGYSPSAVSQQLAQLQKDVNVALVERVGRRLRLTEAGEVLARHAETLLSQAQRAEESVLAVTGRVAGEVRVVGYQTALLHLLIPVLPKLAADYPDLTVDVIDDELVRIEDALTMREVDVVLRDEYSHLTYPRRLGLTAEVLITEPMRIALAEGHPKAGAGEPLHIADLAGLNWAVGLPGTNHHDLLERTCLEVGGFRPRIQHRSNDLLVIFALVAQSRAACVFPDLAMAEGHPGIVVRDLADVRLHRKAVMWTRDGADTRPSVRAVLEALRRSADDLVARRPRVERAAPDPVREPGQPGGPCRESGKPGGPAERPDGRVP